MPTDEFAICRKNDTYMFFCLLFRSNQRTSQYRHALHLFHKTRPGVYFVKGARSANHAP